MVLAWVQVFMVVSRSQLKKSAIFRVWSKEKQYDVMELHFKDIPQECPSKLLAWTLRSALRSMFK